VTRKRSRVTNIEGRYPVRDYSEQQLRTILVEDAVRKHATDLPWFIEAITRIGKLSRRGPEAAFNELVNEVETLTGVASLPMGSVTPAEMQRLLK
jgi:hypothetical protein